jgi:hypothetical protein
MPESWEDHFIAEFYGYKNLMIFEKTIAKPGMSAKEIFSTIRSAKKKSAWLRSSLGIENTTFGRFEIESAVIIRPFDKKRSYYYTFYINAHDGNYSIHLTDINTNLPSTIYVCGQNGNVFQDIYPAHKYKIAVKMAEMAKSDFDIICKKIEEEAFGLHLTED